MQAGRGAEALGLALPLASRHPRDLQMQMEIGFLAREAGAWDDALACFARASLLQPRNPQIANIAANTLASAGRTRESLHAFADLLQRHPDFLEGHVNQAITANEAGDTQALHLTEQSLAQFPNNARLLSVKGDILRGLDRVDEALAALDQAIALEPARPMHHLRRGVALRRSERHDQALEAYDRAEQLGAQGPAFQSAKAAVLLELGRVDDAEALYRDAFRAGDREAGLALLRLRREYRRDTDPASHLAEAARDSGRLDGWLLWLDSLAAFGEFERLADASAEALQIFAEELAVSRAAAIARAWTGDPAGAYDQLNVLAAQAPSAHLFFHDLSEVALALGDGAAAAEHAGAALKRDSYDQAALAFLSLAWRLLDDPRERWLCDYERLVVPVEVMGPDGEEPATFARTVAEALEPLHRTREAPGDQSLRGGTQTSGRLFARSDPTIARFRIGLEAAVRSVIANLPDDATHPFLTRRSTTFRWQGSWSVRLQGDGGRHVPHFHGQGWMSSAYYARLPSVIGSSEGTDGWIAFGAPPQHLGLDLPPRHMVRPREGRLVLFPSYFWHHTQPFSGAEPRLTAAFDIVPF